MPSRIAVVGIVAFWLTVSAYVIYRDVWPRVFATGPPPVSIELSDEAKQNIPARWIIYRGAQRIGRLTTHMKYRDTDDTFLFTYQYSDLELEQAGVVLKVPSATSEVRIMRAGGHLKEQTMTAKVKATYRDVEVVSGTIDVQGVVRDGVLTGRAELKSNFLDAAADLNPVPVPRGTQPLNPLQPMNRLSSVRGGQQWIVHESNPLDEALGELVRKTLAERGIRLPDQPKEESAVAEVGSSPQTLVWQGQEVACWVIEYRRAEPFARTCVRAADGKVLRQERSKGGESLVFERED